MDPALYKVAVEGKAEDRVLQQKASEFSSSVTPKGNTVLHVAALYGHTDLVHKILKLCDALSLLYARNKKNETALHFAAKEGHVGVVSALICWAKTCPQLESGVAAVMEMLRMPNCDNDTALHMAVRGSHYGVVTLLAKADVEFEFPPNKMGETPLYIAAESRFLNCLIEMLNTSTMPTYGGPFGRTALHAAVISESAGCSEALLARENSLCEVADDYGWTPLHYAAKFCDDRIVGDILGVKSSLAYLPAPRDGGWTTAFHIAASEGRIKVMEAILKHCPDAWEMVDSKGQNVLHEAVVSDTKDVTEYILNDPNLNHLIAEKDEDGNTPLHLDAANYVWYASRLTEHPRAKQLIVRSFNKRHSTPLDIAYTCNSIFTGEVIENDLMAVTKGGRRADLTKEKWNIDPKSEEQKAWEDKMKKRMDYTEKVTSAVMKPAKTKIIVATLIATITFAAAFTVPGGYDNSPGSMQGMAVLIKKAAFRAFVITDSIAFICSIAALVGYILLVEEATYTRTLKIAVRICVYAERMFDACVPAVVLAFVTAAYTVLVHSTTLSAAVSVCICVCIFGIIGFPLYLRVGGYEGFIVWLAILLKGMRRRIAQITTIC